MPTCLFYRQLRKALVMAMDTLLSIALATSIGIATHLAVFIRGEWHLSASHILAIHIVVFVSGSIVWYWFDPRDLLEQCHCACILGFAYLAGLLGSIAVYRLFFHRLRHFPGPRLAALTKLWHVFKCRDSRNHLVLDALYKEYGTIVRTGKFIWPMSVQKYIVRH